MALARSLGNNSIKDEGAKHISEALKTNSTLATLRYVAAHLVPYCQYPLTCAFCSRSTLARSMRVNSIGPEGAKHISEALKTNSTLQTLE